jgi:hypothetical protein
LLAHIEIINGLDAIHFVRWQGIKTYYSRFEIIGYPVVDGSAEWALWQMKQGKKVCHKFYTMKTTHCAINDESQVVIFTTPYSVANGGDVVCHADEWLDRRQYSCGVDERTGWQLYEEPQPTYKVRDWVEFRDIEGIKHGVVDGIYDEYSVNYGGTSQSVSEKYITRKLSPSEVVIHIGCLSGTVTYAISDDCFLLAKVNDPQHRACCIDMSMLDTATRELVESLLKAQEEE